mgnify:CR=1 FL=1
MKLTKNEKRRELISMKIDKETLPDFTYEIKVNGKSTGWYGSHSDCIEILKRLIGVFPKLIEAVKDSTGLDEEDQNYYHNVNARHLTFSHQNYNTRTSRGGNYKNAYCKTIAPNNTGRTVFGFDGFVDIWTVKLLKSYDVETKDV